MSLALAFHKIYGSIERSLRVCLDFRKLGGKKVKRKKK